MESVPERIPVMIAIIKNVVYTERKNLIALSIVVTERILDFLIAVIVLLLTWLLRMKDRDTGQKVRIIDEDSN